MTRKIVICETSLKMESNNRVRFATSGQEVPEITLVEMNIFPTENEVGNIIKERKDLCIIIVTKECIFAWSDEINKTMFQLILGQRFVGNTIVKVKKVKENCLKFKTGCISSVLQLLKESAYGIPITYFMTKYVPYLQRFKQIEILTESFVSRDYFIASNDNEWKLTDKRKVIS